MRLELYFTEEEFINFIEDNVSDDDIRMMFENANLEKDEQLLLNNDVYEEFLTKNSYTLDVKNTFENFKGVLFEFRQPIKQYKGKFVA